MQRRPNAGEFRVRDTSAGRLGLARGETGVTLVEAMVALVLFAVGILALAAVQTRSRTVVYATGTETRAMAVCQAQLETARATGFGVAQPGSGQVGNFQWTTEILTVNSSMDRVRVTVSWGEQGRPRSVSLNTLLSAR